MSLRERIAALAVCVIAGGSLCPLWAQLGRASITGIVRDTSGAVIPAVEITAVHTATALTYKTASNDVGNYTLASLPIGEYNLKFTASGFREVSQERVGLTSGQVARLDVTLEVGQAAEKVTVTAEMALLQTETTQAMKDVDAQVFSALPLSFSVGRNMADFAAKLVPGVSGDRIEGTPVGSASVVIDGMNNTSGFVPGTFVQESISPEAIQELTVLTGNVAPEFGRAGGGALNFVLKSGANDVHGSGLYYLRNEVLNANDWNNNLMLAADPDFRNPQTASFKRPMHRRLTAGFSVGGPVYIPKVYNGRDRTFFYFAWERFSYSESGPTNLVRSVPQPEMFDGDLSRLLTGTRVGTDVLGRPVYEGQIYDPSTLRQVNGQFVADAFPGNIIPVSRMSKVARNFKPVFAQYYPPVTSSLTANLYWTRFIDQVTFQRSLKMDHSFSPAHKMSGFIAWRGYPRLFQDAGGLWSLSDPTFGGPLARAMRQERRGYSWNANYDWMISPTLLNHASFGVNNSWNYYGSRHVGKGYATEWGIKGIGLGFPEEKWTAPEFNMGSSPVATFESWGKKDNRDFQYGGYIFDNTLTWQRRSHTVKMGVEFNRIKGEDFRFDNTGGIFNFTARTTAIPGQSYTSRIGNSFASFLLGLVDSASLTPTFNTKSHRDYLAVFVHDSWKVTPRLTLTLGLRWSGNTPIYESQDRIANFSPTLPDPNAFGLPGAVEYMGTGEGRTGKPSPAPAYWKNIGPSFGLAYRVGRKVVVRTGYGITHTPEMIGWSMIPKDFSAGFRPVNSVDANSKGIYLPVFNIDDGYPGTTQEPFLDPSWGQRKASWMISPDYAKPGYVQHFQFGFQVEAARNLLVEADWRASKGTRLHDGGSLRPNQIRADELARGSVLGQIIDSPQKAAAAGLPYPYAGWSGTGANTLMPFPQITTQSLSAWGDPVGFSNYHAANLIVTRRMTQGLHAYAAYTFSKSITDVSDVSRDESTGLQDAYNRTLYKAISPDDRTHNIKSSLMWSLPVGRRRALLGNAGPLLNAIVGNWTVSALLNYSSGTPLGVVSSRTTPVGWNGPAVYANFNTPEGGFRRLFDPANFNPWNADDPGNRFFDPKAFSDASPQKLGTSPIRFPQMRGLWSLNEDATVMKVFPIRERVRLQFRVELFNLLNRHYYGGLEMSLSRSYFGNMRTASGSRSGQAGLRVEW